MKNFILIVVMLIVSESPGVRSESISEGFEFRKTVAIYHLTNDGGIIYVRPDEYNQNHGFVILYEALDQYLMELNDQAFDVSISPSELPVIDELLLLTGDSQKKYFLKEGWFGDGDQWIPMSVSDYEKLKRMIDTRRALAGSQTDDKGLSDFTANISKISEEKETADYGEEFSGSYHENAIPQHAESKSDSSIQDEDKKDVEINEVKSDKKEVQQNFELTQKNASSHHSQGGKKITIVTPEMPDKPFIPVNEFREYNKTWIVVVTFIALFVGLTLYGRRNRD